MNMDFEKWVNDTLNGEQREFILMPVHAMMKLLDDSNGNYDVASMAMVESIARYLGKLEENENIVKARMSLAVLGLLTGYRNYVPAVMRMVELARGDGIGLERFNEMYYAEENEHVE